MADNHKKDGGADDQVLFLEYGQKLIVPVLGEDFGQNHKQTKLKELYKETDGKVTEFSLTPQNDYQARMGWPEEPFLNVMPKGQFEVRKDNWIGYIQPAEYSEEDQTAERKERAEYTKKLIKLGKLNPLIIKGKVIKEKNFENKTEYSVLLFASRKDIDEKSKKAKSLQPIYREKQTKEIKKKRVWLILGIIALIILGIVFWQFSLGLLIVLGILVALGAKK